MSKLIYKICRREEWRLSLTAGIYTGSHDDCRDGFIHFSTSSQVKETAAKHFSSISDLVLLTVDASALGRNLKWEPSRGGDLFPHLYGAMPTTVVRRVDDLPFSAGEHQFPDLDSEAE